MVERPDGPGEGCAMAEKKEMRTDCAAYRMGEYFVHLYTQNAIGSISGWCCYLSEQSASWIQER